VGKIWQQLEAQFPPSTFEGINISTIDSFQGCGKGVIILSCVQGGTTNLCSGGGIGVLKDICQLMSLV
jgi:superfamily I DNA and/or RNA helicase